MAMINYADKVALNSNSGIPDINKCNASDLNDIKKAFNNQVAFGWYQTGLSPTFTYVSWDSSVYTGVVASNLDLTPYLSVGMKVKFTQSATVKFGIITAITSTQITLFMGTDYSLNNSAISNPYYSMLKAPYGFPLSPEKWTIESKITTNKTSGPYSLSGSTTTVYNAFPDLNIKAPIGSWNLLYTINMLSECNTAPGGVKIGYSSAINNQDTFPETNNFWYSQTGSYFWGAFFGNTGINIEAPTQLYFLIRPWWSGVTNTQNFRIDGEKVHSFVKLICNYL